MSIRLAFSTLACPSWTLDQAIEQAGSMGYQGIELVTRFGRDTPTLACDPQQHDPAEIRKKLKQAGIEPVCLSTNLSLSVKGKDQEQAVMQMARVAITQAAAIGAPAVRLLAWDVPRGEIVRQTLGRVARQAKALADVAGSQGVQILLENIGAVPKASDWWWCLDLIRHPMVALSWNVRAAALAGEKPAISIPMLNSRIRLVKLTDFAKDSTRPAPLGDGQLDVPQVIHRLMGVGYSGFVSVEWDRLADASLAAGEEVLLQARERLTGWLEAVALAAEAKKPPRKTLPAMAAAAKAGVRAVKPAAGGLASPSPEDEAAQAASAARSLPDAAAARAAKLAAAKAKSEARIKAAAEKEAATSDATNAPASEPAPVMDAAAIRAAKIAAAKAKSEARRAAAQQLAKNDKPAADDTDADAGSAKQ